MNDAQTIAVYDAQIEAYVELIEQQEVDSLLAPFIKRLNPGDYVLDLGCGPGNSAAAMRDQGLRVDPIDASLEMVQLANSKYQVDARQAFFDQVEGQAVYDAVWANYSLLHAPREDLPRLLANLRNAIKDGGIFHLAMKLGANSKRDSLGRMYAYYSQNELSEYLKSCGFTVQEVTTGQLTGLAGEQESWIAILSKADTIDCS